jgi:hypothetical protein
MLKTLLLLLLPAFAFAQPVLTSLDNATTKKAIYKAPNGKQYKIQFWKDKTTGNKISKSAVCGEDKFKGVARKIPKTSIATGDSINFTTLLKFLKWLPKDSVMINKFKKAALRKMRQPEENINITLDKNIYLYAIKKEPDNDYHLIIGNNKKADKAVFFNVELSGIGTKNKAVLQKVRDFFEDNFVSVCGKFYVVFIENPIPVKLTGSLFYDIDHAPGEVGPGILKPKTSWEIHPVTSIAFN